MGFGRPKEHDAGREKVRRLLQRHQGEWVSLREIVRLGVAQYNARILELRREGMAIDNKTEYVEKKKVSWFRLRRPGQAEYPQNQAKPENH